MKMKEVGLLLFCTLPSFVLLSNRLNVSSTHRVYWLDTHLHPNCLFHRRTLDFNGAIYPPGADYKIQLIIFLFIYLFILLFPQVCITHAGLSTPPFTHHVRYTSPAINPKLLPPLLVPLCLRRESATPNQLAGSGSRL